MGKVLNALAEKSPHVPYRDSKLTHMLKDSLEGNSKTMMIITLSPSNNEYQETSSSLKFGQRVLKVERGRVKLDN